MFSRFELASGSVVGIAHRAAGRNNQDALSIWRGPEAWIAVVADGCGSSRHSELGAQLGARLTVETLRRFLREVPAWCLRAEIEGVLERTLSAVAAQLRTLAASLGGDLSEVVLDCLLFTLAGAVVTGQRAWLFGLGDGIFALNGDVTAVSFPDNAPPYLGYALLSPGPTTPFSIHYDVPVGDLESLLIATDGLAPLAGAELAEIWRNDRHFRNPQGLPRRLTQLSRVVPRIDWEARRVERERGLFADDATVVVVRRRPPSRGAARP